MKFKVGDFVKTKTQGQVVIVEVDKESLYPYVFENDSVTRYTRNSILGYVRIRNSKTARIINPDMKESDCGKWLT